MPYCNIKGVEAMFFCQDTCLNLLLVFTVTDYFNKLTI